MVLAHALIGAAAAQDSGRLRGRVLERVSLAPIAGAAIEIDGIVRARTDSGGAFMIQRVSYGRRVIRVTALGYSPVDTTLVIASDAAIEVQLAIAPVRLDSITAMIRRTKVHGEVRDRNSRIPLIDVAITAGSRRTMTNHMGSFTLDSVPVGVYTHIVLNAFGYLPRNDSIAPTRDTTFQYFLSPDSVALTMIEAQRKRLRERSHGVIDPLAPAIDRDELLLNLNGSLADLVSRRFGGRLAVRCIVIDDVHSTNTTLQDLRHMLADRFERVELLYRGKMLRLYTREYIRRMVSGHVTLSAPLLVETRPPFCR